MKDIHKNQYFLNHLNLYYNQDEYNIFPDCLVSNLKGLSKAQKITILDKNNSNQILGKLDFFKFNNVILLSGFLIVKGNYTYDITIPEEFLPLKTQEIIFRKEVNNEYSTATFYLNKAGKLYTTYSYVDNSFFSGIHLY